MLLDKLPVPGRPTFWMIVGQGLIALAVGAMGVVWTFLLSSILSFVFLPLSGRRPDIGWLVVLGVNGPLRQYFSLYWGVS